MQSSRKSDWILYGGTFPPRECGIATFTQDISRAVSYRLPDVKAKILAINKGRTDTYNYPSNVIFEINESHLEEYEEIAEEINSIPRIKLVNIQHEFGIFGGEWGKYLIRFLKTLNKKVIITFHSVIPNPDPKLKEVVQAIDQEIACIIVMTQKAVDILREEYQVQSDIEIIPHGIPTVSFSLSGEQKARRGYKDRIILSSFGLMSEDKGYEYVIDALPEVVKRFPNLLYLIIGATHPIVRKKKGEKYRNFLEDKVHKLNLEANVKFYNKYLTLREIIKYLKATDIYISSCLNPNQITSGTLVYAMGCGRPVISTPFLHAQDIVNPKRGILVNFRDPSSFSKAILRLAEDPLLRNRMQKNAYAYTRRMIWPNVALFYIRVFKKYGQLGKKVRPKVFPLTLKHLFRLTDDFGVIQFADYNMPNKSSGYTLDDVARAMIVCCLYYNLYKKPSVLRKIETYLDFITYVQTSDGRFYNFVDYGRKVNTNHFSEDAYGRAMWSLGYLIATKSAPLRIRRKAKLLFEKGLLYLDNIRSPRATAFLLIGLYFYNQTYKRSANIILIKKLADILVSLFVKNTSDDWRWFEKKITYSNARLSEALLYAYLATGEEKYFKVGKESLDFLNTITFQNRAFIPIGQKGWYVKGQARAYFDQQPIDVAAMVQALILNYKISKEEKYLEQAFLVFDWFLGNNTLSQVLYDFSTGGCSDGLGKDSINLNQGAESTISYLMARLSLDRRLIPL